MSPNDRTLLSLPDDLLALAIGCMSASTLIRASSTCITLRKLTIAEARSRAPIHADIEPKWGEFESDEEEKDAFEEWACLSYYVQIARMPLVVAFRFELNALLTQVPHREWRDSGAFVYFRLTPSDLDDIVTWESDTALIHGGDGLSLTNDLLDGPNHIVEGYRARQCVGP